MVPFGCLVRGGWTWLCIPVISLGGVFPHTGPDDSRWARAPTQGPGLAAPGLQRPCVRPEINTSPRSLDQ